MSDKVIVKRLRFVFMAQNSSEQINVKNLEVVKCGDLLLHSEWLIIIYIKLNKINFRFLKWNIALDWYY